MSPRPKPYLRDLEDSLSKSLYLFQRRELELGSDLLRFYENQFEGFEAELNRFFYQYFTIVPVSKEQIWDSSRLKDVLPDATNLITDFTTALEDPVLNIWEEDLIEGYQEGEDLELWWLYQSGVDITPYERESDSSIIKASLIFLGIGGLGYSTRLAHWTQAYIAKMISALQSLVGAGANLSTTQLSMKSIYRGLSNAVSSLARNELKLAYGAGADNVRSRFRPNIQAEVWITKDDTHVCAFCRDLHLEITSLQPIVDSHPNCRCRKVSIVLDYKYQPIDYVEFLKRIGRR